MLLFFRTNIDSVRGCHVSYMLLPGRCTLSRQAEEAEEMAHYEQRQKEQEQHQKEQEEPFCSCVRFSCHMT